MFPTVPPSSIRISSLYTQQWSCVTQICWQFAQWSEELSETCWVIFQK